MENTLPQTVYAVMEDDGDGDFFVCAHTNPDTIDHGSVVGIYELKETKTLVETKTLQ